MRRDVSWPAVAVVAAAVAVTVMVTYLLATWPPDPPPSAVPPLEARTQADRDGQGGGNGDNGGGRGGGSTGNDGIGDDGAAVGGLADETLLVVLGDSFTSGTPANDGPEWPQLLAQQLGWEVNTHAVPGSGYVSAGRGAPFGERVDDVVAEEGDVVLVAGGISDLGLHPVPAVVEAADDVVSRLVQGAPDAQVVLVSPFSNGPPGPLTTRLSDQLSAVADEYGVEYVDATRFLPRENGLIGDDGVHPTDAGHQRIARQMESALDSVGIGSPVPSDG